MPSNQEYKGKGMKGRNYDESSGVGTSSAGVNGTTGNLNDGGRDGGVGTPDMADSGNLQQQAGQPGGTPAQGDSVRSQGNLQGGSQAGSKGGQQQQQPQGGQQSQQGQPDGQSRQSGNQADGLRGGEGDREMGRQQTSQDEVGTSRPREDPSQNG